MSFYPSDQGAAGQPEGYPGPLDPGASRKAGLNRIRPAAIGMIIAGVLNLLLAMVAIGAGLLYGSIPPDQAEKMLRAERPDLIRDLEAQGRKVEDVLHIITFSGFGTGTGSAVTGLLAILAGVLMLRGKGFVFAVISAILLAIPVLSCSGCCGVGEGIGIWALVVLFNEEVKAAFR